MFNFKYIADLVTYSQESKKSLSKIIWEWETQQNNCEAEEVWQKMRDRLLVIREAANAGIKEKNKTFNNLIGGDAYRVTKADYLLGSTAKMAMAYALGVSEVNANMGKIVACPTAGSCGIVPGAVLAVADLLKCDDNIIINALFTAAGIGIVIAQNATVSGAVGGCQAECGAAGAMAAGAVVEMMGGSAAQSAHAAALALKNLLGLVCDPVAGLVEVPCVKRNGFVAVHALAAAEMALAGVESVIPVDEVIDVMYRIGQLLPASLRETSEAGLAKSPTAVCIAQRLLK